MKVLHSICQQIWKIQQWPLLGAGILHIECVLHIECSTFHSIIFQDLE